MFRLRCTIDCQPRTKNGQPPHSTTGVASANSIQLGTKRGTACGARQHARIAISSSGTVSATLTQNRRVMSTSSDSPPPAVTTRGSSAMPHIGQPPGSARTISGCIGQVYSVLATGGRPGSSAIPHLDSPRPFCRTSGCIGQVYEAASAAGALALGFAGAASTFFFAKKLSGSLVNLSRQCALQK